MNTTDTATEQPKSRVFAFAAGLSAIATVVMAIRFRLEYDLYSSLIGEPEGVHHLDRALDSFVWTMMFLAFAAICTGLHRFKDI